MSEYSMRFARRSMLFLPSTAQWCCWSYLLSSIFRACLWSDLMDFKAVLLTWDQLDSHTYLTYITFFICCSRVQSSLTKQSGNRLFLGLQHAEETTKTSQADWWLKIARLIYAEICNISFISRQITLLQIPNRGLLHRLHVSEVLHQNIQGWFESRTLVWDWRVDGLRAECWSWLRRKWS